MDGSFINELFDQEPSGTFADGHIFRSEPELSIDRRGAGVGYWRCDLNDHDKLTWTDKVYEIFGLHPGDVVDRNWVVQRYREDSRRALERVRSFGLKRDFGFILDAAIQFEGGSDRWIRILAVPVIVNDRVVALHGWKRAL